MRVYRFEEPVAASLAPQRRRRRRWPGVLAAALLLVAVIAGGALLWLGRSDDGAIPLGTTIDGVEVGGLTHAEAVALVRDHGRQQLARGLVLVAGANRFAIRPGAIRLRADVPEAVAAASADPPFLERVRARLGMGESHAIPLRYVFSRPALAQALLPVRQAVTVAPVSATIRAAGGGAFAVDAAHPGTSLDDAALEAALHDIGSTGPRIDVPTRVVPPVVTTAQARQAAAQATDFVRTPHTAEVDGQPTPVPQRVAMRAVDFVPGAEGGIRFSIRPSVLRAWFSTVYGKREVAPRNARFTVDARGNARILGSRNGRGVDVERLIGVWQADPTATTATTTIGVREPALTSEKAQHLGVTRVVGEFFTPYSGGPRVLNIQRAAKILDQYIIPAGGTFSLNKALGQRTEARGFVKAPMIGDGGVLTVSVGGGVSQVATTTFNAAFFAGLKLIAHTPHSFWITRYPKGREATVSWGGPELIFKNVWKAPIVILTHTDDTGITVRMLSAPLGRKVVAYEGEPYAIRKAKVTRVVDRTLPPGTRQISQMPGEDGFSIRYGRRVYRDGKLIAKEMWTWRYAPENGVILVGPKAGAGGGGQDGAATAADGAATAPDGATTTG